MEKHPVHLNSEVTEFLDKLRHPFNKEIELLRSYILSTDKDLRENIKWNAPNYHIDGGDRITMKILPPKEQVQLILHRGAKKQAEPEQKLIDADSKMLTWKENDRAIITFKSRQAIEDGKAELMAVIKDWINAAGKP